MIFAALNEAADRDELLLEIGGMCRFHKRRDGVVVIRELIVLPKRRRVGVGRVLVEQVLAAHPKSDVLAKCPREYESNEFWRRVGFTPTDNGGRCIEWRLCPT